MCKLYWRQRTRHVCAQTAITVTRMCGAWVAREAGARVRGAEHARVEADACDSRMDERWKSMRGNRGMVGEARARGAAGRRERGLAGVATRVGSAPSGSLREMDDGHARKRRVGKGRNADGERKGADARGCAAVVCFAGRAGPHARARIARHLAPPIPGMGAGGARRDGRGGAARAGSCAEKLRVRRGTRQREAPAPFLKGGRRRALRVSSEIERVGCSR